MVVFRLAIMLKIRHCNGRPMSRHVILPIDARHFDRWLKLLPCYMKIPHFSGKIETRSIES